VIKQKQFFKKYRVKEADFRKTKLLWKDLIEIYEKHKSEISQYDDVAKYVTNSLIKADQVHSIRYRIKNPEHLIHKIIRKKIENNTLEININNYTNIITDLIGIRVLHLFKEQWINIHYAIVSNWDVHGKPNAKIRAGDSPVIRKGYESNDCEIVEHPYGYRSVHYIIISKPARISYFVEIQVRTIFEEGWAEIDHDIRYPYFMDNSLLEQYLVIFNRLAGSSDEMGSYVKKLKSKLLLYESKIKEAEEEKEAIRNDLKNKINQLNIEKKEKEELKAEIDSLNRASTPYVSVFDTSELPKFGGSDSPFDTSEFLKFGGSDSPFDTSEFLKFGGSDSPFDKNEPIILTDGDSKIDIKETIDNESTPEDNAKVPLIKAKKAEDHKKNKLIKPSKKKKKKKKKK
jgi:ppGpp synthetase/RelA/SpoT-type nucleotidyltranferase